MIKALVVGGTAGIGLSVVEQMRSQGVRVDNPPPSEFDVTKPIQMLAYLTAREPYRQVVFSAGINTLGMLGTGITWDTRDVMAVNLTGFISLMDVLVSRNGKDTLTDVVAITSDSARVARRSSIAYCSSKAGLEMAVKVAARELAPYWRVNGVAPGVVADTPLTNRIDKEVQGLRGWTPEEASKYELATIPMGRRAEKDEIAAAVMLMLSGPDYMTGAILDVTGGK